MKIAMISKVWSTNGGVGSYLLNLSSAFKSLGHEVLAIHSDERAIPGSPLACQFYVDGFGEFGDEETQEKYANRVMALIESFNPDIVHTHANDNFKLDFKIRDSFPAVKSLHVYDFCPSGNKFHHISGNICKHPTSALCVLRMCYKRCFLSKRPWVIWWYYRRCVEANRNNTCYTKLIVGSEYVKNQAMASGYPASQIEVLYYFTELPALPAPVNNSEKMILFVGRVVREKGLSYLLSILSLVQTPWRLVVDGDGPDLGRAQRLAAKMGLEDQIEFVGWAPREKHLAYYRQASVVVVPSVWPEPFGMVGIEAMSYGKPVVAFRVGGIPEWLEDGVTGFLIKPYDVKEMAEKVSYLIEHPGIANEMGMRGRKRVEQEFNQEKHISTLLEIYRDVIDEKARS